MHITYIDEKERLVAFMCPGCDRLHQIRHGEGGWSWNGSRDKPTFRPSVLSNSGGECPDVPICHSYITDGVITFLLDSTHALAGDSVVLKPW